NAPAPASPAIAPQALRATVAMAVAPCRSEYPAQARRKVQMSQPRKLDSQLTQKLAFPHILQILPAFPDESRHHQNKSPLPVPPAHLLPNRIYQRKQLARRTQAGAGKRN